MTIPAPMLASHGRPTGSLAGWTAEFKADGFRCQVAVLGGRRVVRTRGGHDIADRLPELAYLSELGVDLILDGELIAGAGRPADFYQVIGSVSSTRRNRPPLTLMAFDLLWLDGRPLVDRPHARPPDRCWNVSTSSVTARSTSSRRTRRPTSTTCSWRASSSTSKASSSSAAPPATSLAGPTTGARSRPRRGGRAPAGPPTFDGTHRTATSRVMFRDGRSARHSRPTCRVADAQRGKGTTLLAHRRIRTSRKMTPTTTATRSRARGSAPLESSRNAAQTRSRSLMVGG